MMYIPMSVSSGGQVGCVDCRLIQSSANTTASVSHAALPMVDIKYSLDSNGNTQGTILNQTSHF